MPIVENTLTLNSTHGEKKNKEKPQQITLGKMHLHSRLPAGQN